MKEETYKKILDYVSIIETQIKNIRKEIHALQPKKIVPVVTGPITSEQLEELEWELSDYPEVAEEVMDTFNITTLADMPKSKYHESIRRIRKIKGIMEGTLNISTMK